MKRECQSLEPLLHDYAEGWLDESKKASLLRHLQRCPACQEKLKAWSAVGRALRGLRACLRLSCLLRLLLIPNRASPSNSRSRCACPRAIPRDSKRCLATAECREFYALRPAPRAV